MDTYLIASLVIGGIIVVGIIIMVVRSLPPRVSTDRNALKRADTIIHERKDQPPPNFIGAAGGTEGSAVDLTKSDARADGDIADSLALLEAEQEDLAARTRPVAYITLGEVTFPALAEVLEFARGRYPDLGALEAPADTFGQGPFEVKIGNGRFHITYLSEPLPWRSLRDACGHARWWPDATRAMKHHVGAIKLELVESVDRADHIGNIVTLTALAASVGEVAQGTGFYWPAGGMVHPTKTLLALVDAIPSGRIPIQLWIDVRDYVDPDGSQGVETIGMMLFINREVETEPKEEVSITDARGQARDAISYILEHESTPGHGSTLNVGSGRMFVRHAMSRHNATLPVLNLEAQ